MIHIMKNRLGLYIIIVLLLCTSVKLYSRPNLYMLSLASNENVSTTSTIGSRITVGFGSEGLLWHGTFRQQHPYTNITMHVTKKVHAIEPLLTGSLLGNLSYHSYGFANGTTSLIGAYKLNVSIPSKNFPSLISAGVGLHGKMGLSKSYDSPLWSLDPHTSFSITQGLFDRLFVTLFIATDMIGMREGNLSYWYGFSTTLALTETLLLVVKPVVRLSDFINESRFVIERELSLSLCYSDGTSKRAIREEMGVWL